ncbi:MAG: sigma-70 family RNA polymerase sigma factor [Acidobacteriota bacterium]|nr:sigma-70 family RNA polymerase sigma factor [Acidobacteriota bacterium]
MLLTISDKRLVARALKGHADAWDKLIRRYEARVYNFALRMAGNREDAMDLMQEVFLSVYRNLGSYAGRAEFASWLFAIASRRAVDFYRRRKPAETLDSEPEDLLGREESPLRQVVRNQTNANLMNLLSRLDIEQRLVIELKFFQDRTFDEMSETLGVSANTLKTRFYTALKKIKSMPEAVHVL